MAIEIEPRPIWPRVGASCAVFRDGAILLGERGKGAMAGRWSLPGGHVEPGETTRDAACREVREETGVVCEVLGLVDLNEVIQRDGGGGDVSWHYVITVYFGRWVSGEPVAASDCRAARFIPLGDVTAVPLTPGATAFIEKAAALFAGRR